MQAKKTVKNGQPVEITAVCDDITASVSGDIPEKALNRPTDADMLTKQLSKLGDTVFSFGKLTADIDEGLIVPASKLNELRREVMEKLTNRVIEKNTPKEGFAEINAFWAKDVIENSSAGLVGEDKSKLN